MSVREFDGLVFESSGKTFPNKCGSNVYQVSICFPMLTFCVGNDQKLLRSVLESRPHARQEMSM